MPEIRQIVKETTEQEAKEAINAINVNKNPSLDELNTLQRQNENFNIVGEGKPKTDYNAKLDLAPNVRDLSKLTTDEITADLEYLAQKHPEIFNKPSEVFKLIREIKDNPTHYFNNNRLDYALLVKRLENDKIGKLAINKENGEVKHATKVSDRDLKRLKKVSDKNQEADTSIIPTFISQGSKSQSELGLPKRQTAGTSTLPAPLKTADKMPLKQDANSVGETYSSATNDIIPKNIPESVKIRDTDVPLSAKVFTIDGKKIDTANALNDSTLYRVSFKDKDKNDSELIFIKADEVRDLMNAQQEAKAIKNQHSITQNAENLEKKPLKGRDMPITQNFDENMAQNLAKTSDRVAVDILDENIAKELGFKYPNVKRTISGDEIRHTLNRHGENSPLVKQSGQKAVTLDDISKWTKYSDEADIRAISRDNLGQDVILSGKQINGYYVVVESVRRKNNELAFKTMYFQKGDLKDSKAFKEAQTLLRGYEPDANSIAPLKTNDIIPQKEAKETAESAKAQLRSHFSGRNLTDTQRAELRAVIEKEHNITPIKEFGTNYAEYYHDGFQAILKLEKERSGQVAGAFHKEWLGDIDLVWGDDKIGLKKIIERHADDFKEFGGVAKGLDKIVEFGEVVSKNGVNTIWHKHGDDYFLVGLSKGYNGKGENEWIITSYKKTKGAIPDEVKGDTANLSAYSDEFKGELTSSHPPFTDESIIPQNKAKDTKEAEYKARELYFTLSKDGGKNGFIMLSEKEGLEYLTKKYGITKEHAIKTKDKLRKNIENLADITPIKEFGTNYAEFYHDGKGAVKKLLIEKQGQVAGAFYRKDLGDITLAWGKTNDELNGFGLEKIVKKHLGDFVEFNGATPYEKLANGLNEIIKNGEVADKNGVKTILYNNKDKVYAVGLSKGWHGKGENEWVITAYEKKNFKNGSGDSKTISAYAEIKEAKTPASTADNIIPQNATKTGLIKNERGIIAEVSHGNAFKDDIPFSHPVIGGGLFGGGLNGVSRDENGDVSLDFDNFIKGFFGGAVGAKLASAGLKKSAPNLYKKFMGYANKYPKMAQINPELLGKMLRSGRGSELKELERGLR